MQLTGDIHPGYWVEWCLWIALWIILLIITYQQIQSFRSDVVDVAKAAAIAATGTHPTTISKDCSSPTSTSKSISYHRKSSRKLSLKKLPRKYSLNLRRHSMGYHVRAKKLQLQFAGIIGNILCLLPLFPSLRFLSHSLFIRFHVILTYIPCICGMCFYSLDIYLSALRTFDLRHLSLIDRHPRNVTLYLQLKALQHRIRWITISMSLLFLLSVLGVSILQTASFWICSESSCFILWWLLHQRYQAIYSLQCIFTEDLLRAQERLLTLRSRSESKSECQSESIEISGQNIVSNVDDDNSNDLKDPMDGSHGTDGIIIDLDGHSDPKPMQITVTDPDGNVHGQRGSFRASLSAISSAFSISLRSNSFFISRRGSAASSRRSSAESDCILPVPISVPPNVSDLEPTDQNRIDRPMIYNTFNDIDDEKQMTQIADKLEIKIKKIRRCALRKWMFSSIWFGIGTVYLIRRIYLLQTDWNGAAVQFSYSKNHFVPLTFEIVPFLILWLYAIYFGKTWTIYFWYFTLFISWTAEFMRAIRSMSNHHWFPVDRLVEPLKIEGLTWINWQFHTQYARTVDATCDVDKNSQQKMVWITQCDCSTKSLDFKWECSNSSKSLDFKWKSWISLKSLHFKWKTWISLKTLDFK